MARLVPAFIEDDAPSGEKAVYRMLANGPADWVVIHSLDLAPWDRGRRTEIDFLIVIPRSGVLCVEVKSHQDIHFDGERWWPGSIKRSPFKQAVDASHAFHRRIARLAAYGQSLPVAHTCIFPNSPFNVDKNLSICSWELMDGDAFAGFESGHAFCADLEQRLIQAIRDEGITPLDQPLPPQRVDDLVRLCTPVRRRRPEAIEESRRRKREIDSALTQQQKPVLRLAEYNERLLVTGGAGTGKTLIALELAQRLAATGKRVALVTYNVLIGQWLNDRCVSHEAPPNLVVGNIHRLLITIADLELPDGMSGADWTEDIPLAVMDRLTDPEFASTAIFDVVVVDEVQDILTRPLLWECLMALLEGGVRGGRYALFGDTEHQVLSIGSTLRIGLENLCQQGHPVHWPLFENCRNLRIVGNAALQLSGFPSNTYSDYLRPSGSHADVEFVSYTSEDDEMTQLRSVIRSLRDRGYKDEDITVLSMTASDKSVAHRLASFPDGPRMHHYRAAKRGIGYGSVHGYKGMESSAIVVTDISSAMGEVSRSIFYTALTRSTGVVQVLCRQDDAKQIYAWSQGKKS